MTNLNNNAIVSVRELQLELLKILVEIDTFCKKNDIRYSLYAGTLLGAVRHHGFIPWDDDADICMPRDQYEKFLICWEKEHPEGFFYKL